MTPLLVSERDWRSYERKHIFNIVTCNKPELILLFYVILNFARATFMDPGYLPRGVPGEKVMSNDKTSPPRPIMYKTVQINGVPTRLKWCVTYHLELCKHHLLSVTSSLIRKPVTGAAMQLSLQAKYRQKMRRSLKNSRTKGVNGKANAYSGVMRTNTSDSQPPVLMSELANRLDGDTNASPKALLLRLNNEENSLPQVPSFSLTDKQEDSQYPNVNYQGGGVPYPDKLPGGFSYRTPEEPTEVNPGDFFFNVMKISFLTSVFNPFPCFEHPIFALPFPFPGQFINNLERGKGINSGPSYFILRYLKEWLSLKSIVLIMEYDIQLKHPKVAVKVQPIARSDSYAARQKVLQQPLSSVCTAAKSRIGGVSQQASLLLHPSSTTSCQFYRLGEICRLCPISYNFHTSFHLVEVTGIIWSCSTMRKRYRKKIGYLSSNILLF
ncbi:putative palmitoyltransferase ZDHHC5 [Echinococcus granulosus]|uniref:Palmitoyltransferase ZDHHC5 n=1 Tax=Echinococcus granulosus TaxID=6210 RepID=W6UF64_ECHGR|nr:putative palmitoyltransferase ZDHHC5 [Echinococcus granulosus]EUB59521.1 putative palmitoyltransferase ZDHHC5 [Echinococcus granulosus]